MGYKKTDEHEKDFEEIERLTEEFSQKWKSFFNGIWEEIKESTEENIENNIKKAWKKQNKDFYIHYIKKAYDIGEKRAQNVVEQVFTDEENNVNIRIGIEREDIQEELLNNALLRVSKMEQTTIEEIRKILAKGYEQGESWKEQKKKIENKIKNPVRAEMIAITELGFAYNTSTKNTYRGAGASKVAWHASLDLKTCDGCRALHGKVFDIDKAPDNPLHPRCRCTWLPVFSEGKGQNTNTTIKGQDEEDLKKIIRRNSKERKREKENIKTMSYNDLPKNIRMSFEEGLKYANADTRELLERQLKNTKFVFSNERNAYSREYDYIKLKPDIYKIPSTISHEVFHQIDAENGITKKGIFKKALEQDYERILFLSEGNIKEYMKKHYKNVIYYNEDNEIRLMKEYRGISDILSGLTKNEVFLGYGHDNEYWEKNKLNLSKEAWAQYGRTTYDNYDEPVEMFRFLFPNFYQRVIMEIKMLKKR